MARHFIPLLALSSVGVADVTLTITKTWNAIDITVLPHTTISGGCKTVAVVTVTGSNSADALNLLRDLPCPTTTTTEPSSAVLTTTVTTPTTATGTPSSAPTTSISAPRPNAAAAAAAVGSHGAMDWAIGTGVVMLLGMWPAVHLIV